MGGIDLAAYSYNIMVKQVCAVPLMVVSQTLLGY